MEWWNLLVPRLRARDLPHMVGLALLGAVVAGGYGIVHDQITFTLAPEYFTKLKFHQFFWADFGWPDRAYAGAVGFFASWWVGLFCAWFLARLAVPAWPPPKAFRETLVAFAITFGGAIWGAVGGYLWGSHLADVTAWEPMARGIGVDDLPAFVLVAQVHNGSYLGGAAGMVVAIVRVKKRVRGLRSPLEARSLVR